MKEYLEKFLTGYEQELRNAADDMRAETLPEPTEELFSLFERTGNRTSYEAVYFRRRKFLAVFGMAAFLWKKQEDIHKLCEVIREICREVCWALPAHVDRERNPDWMVTVDLFASETAFALTEIGALLGDALPQKLRELMREKVMERVLIPFEQSPIPCGVWENCDHNWNAVCSGSVGCTAIYLLKEEPKRLDKLLLRLQNSLVHYVDGFAEDGACMEGVGYFTYGMSFYAAFSEKLEEYTNGAVDLMAGEKLRRIMEFQQKCYFPGGLSVSFSDGSSHEKFRVGLTCYLAAKDKGVRFPSMELAAGLDSDTCYRWAELYRDYAFTKRYLESGDFSKEVEETSVPQQVTLPAAQWTFCQGPKESAMAAKGGHNGEPHNHNDVGSFHYVVGKESFLADLGAGEYTKEYFRDETRYTIFVNQSLSHNLPIINGHGQMAGEAFGCTRFHTDGQGHTEISFEKTYGEEQLRQCARILDFDAEKGDLKVCDHFAAEGEMSVLERLVTPWRPEIEGDRVILRGNSHCCVLKIHTGDAIQTITQTYSDHDGKPATVYLIQWPVCLVNGEGTSTFELTVIS